MNINRSTYISVFLWLIVFLSAVPSFAQKDLKKADESFQKGEFCEAISYYSRHLNAFVDKNALVKRGRSYYHCNQVDEAIQDFNDAKLLNYNKEDIEYYLAKAYQQKNDFESAIMHFKNYLSENLNNKYIRERITDEIKRCAKGINLQYNQSTDFIQNLGPGVNTKGNEINMIESPQDPHRYYYSQSKHSNPSEYDIEVYTIGETDWKEAIYLNPYHSSYNEVINGISADGQNLYFSRYNQKTKKNMLLVDRYVAGDEPLSNIQLFEGPIKYELGDRDFFKVNDSLFLFSSNRLEGYGGYDLFLTGFSNGFWFEPINLGKKINSSFDEITPSFDPVNSILFFSSDNTNSMGGFDIFHSRYSLEENNWQKPQNLGFPYNSAGNDFNYKIGFEGKSALLTSDRKTDGYGGFDIYQIVLTETDQYLTGEKLESFLRGRELVKSYRRFGLQKHEIAPNNIDTTRELVKNDIPDFGFEKKLDEISEQATETKENVTQKSAKEEYILVKSLFFQNEKDILENPALKSYIESITETMIEHPGLSLKMTGHFSPGISSWQDLQQTIELLLPIVKFMSDGGVAPDHIFIAGAGSTLPVAKVEVNERLRTASERYNNRLQFRFFGDDRIKIKHEQPFVVQHLRDDNWYLYRSIEQELAYKLEVEIDTKEQYDLAIQWIPQCLAEMDIFTTDKRYFFGVFTSFKEARLAATALVRETGLNARVRPFVNETEVNGDNLLEFAKTHTDLVNYLESLN